ncbi:MAG: carboxypeptidase M32 [Promethearchaeota archaeon]
MKIVKEYDLLLERVKRLMVLGGVRSLLYWDFETYMPPKGVEQRSAELRLVSELMHRWATDPELGKLLDAVERSPGHERMTDVERRNVFLVRRDYDRETRVPLELVKELAEHEPRSIAAWKRAKAKRDFGEFRPFLEKMVDLVRRKAEAINPDADPYDVLLDLHEPGLTSDMVAREFAFLAKRLPKLTAKCVEHRDEKLLKFTARRVPVDAQRRLTAWLCKFVQYDLNRGRVDETEHPFTTGVYDDVRILTHYHEDRVLSSVYSVLHEAGHGIYEQNLPVDLRWQPVGTSCSYGVHESQSRFVENVVGRSAEFWGTFLPEFVEATGFQDLSLEAATRAANDVRPTKIRIEADEVTYSLHVVLRFELESELVRGNLDVKELPQVWNEKVDRLLGVEVEHDAEGVLQDTHWAGGSFGYFPSYVMGNLYDGAFLRALEREEPGWRERLQAGDSSTLLGWLRRNVHERGNLHDPAELVELVTGNRVEAAPFVEYLETKMGRLLGWS